MSDILDQLNEAALFATNRACTFDGQPDEAGMRDLGYAYGHLHREAFTEIERLRSRLADLEAERALIIQRAENAEAALVEAKALRETRAKELSYVVEACTAALVIRTTHESRDALRDLRAWATNRIDAHLAEDA